MNDPIFSKIIQAHQDVRRAQAEHETRKLILFLAIFCGLGIIIIQLMGA